MALYKTEMLSRQLESFCAHQDEICASLTQYSDCADITAVCALRDGFRRKMEDFFREDRKYNVAVIGQVKAGKTSFLNTLFFGGEEVLPKDAMPKTAALTRIEYAPKNSIEVEYYSPEDWVWLKRLASSRESSDRARAATETVIQAESSGIPVQELIFKGSETREFSSVTELMGELNDYVGENGTHTPLVKAATLRLALEPLRDISVVDTPGLNDPIPSRTQRTREFIETCDAAFFLSRASYFLDRNDMELLTSSLPRKGVRRLVLMASQFDSAIMDLIYDCADIDAAVELAKRQLTLHAESNIEAAELEMRRSGCSPHVAEVVEPCRRPVFFSAMADDLARKPREKYTEQESVIRRGLECHGEITDEKLLEIGNMAKVRELFSSMVEEKDRLLERKAAAMAVVGQSDLAGELARLKNSVEENINGPLAESRAGTAKKLEEITVGAGALRGAIAAAYAEYLSGLDARLSAAGMNLRGAQEKQAVDRKRAVAVQTNRQTVSDSVFYKPWTWGKSHDEVTSSEKNYTYVDPEDLAENLRRAASEAQLLHDSVFSAFADTSRLCARITAAVSDDLAATGREIPTGELERWIKIAKGRIVIPRAKIDPTPYIGALERRFPDKLRSGQEQEIFRSYAQETMGSLSDGVTRQFEESARTLRESAENSAARFSTLAVADRVQEAAKLRAELNDMDGEIARRRELAEVIEQYI